MRMRNYPEVEKFSTNDVFAIDGDGGGSALLEQETSQKHYFL